MKLGDRMKAYEKTQNTCLYKRMPVIIRLDGKAFHTYTRGFDRPFDYDLHEVRAKTLQTLCEEIQETLFGYSQSDEISLVLKDWNTFKTSAWFNNNIQKLCSVSASICSVYFNKFSQENGSSKFKNKLAIFDSRCFNLPKEEVVNYLLWRQQDCERNSINMVAQSLYSHRELQNLSTKTLLAKLEEEQGIVWGEPSYMAKKR